MPFVENLKFRSTAQTAMPSNCMLILVVLSRLHVLSVHVQGFCGESMDLVDMLGGASKDGAIIQSHRLTW